MSHYPAFGPPPGMRPFRPEQLAITVARGGSRQFARSSQPTRFGRYSEIRTRDHEFHFNPNGQIRFVRGLGSDWPHPFEYLKRTDGNDWIYYTVGAAIQQRGIRDWLGEYYLPCFAYQSNEIVRFTPYSLPAVTGAFAAWAQLYANICTMPMEGLAVEKREFLSRVAYNDDSVLHARAGQLHTIIGGQASVLPPDTRHVDYDVIPLTIADGCLYNCRFCCVKSGLRHQPRTMENIREQIRALKTFYGRDLSNRNALFLGSHDALAAGADRVVAAALEAFEAFDMENAYMRQPRLFLFGSVDAFLRCSAADLEVLEHLPFDTCINIGLESVDGNTLKEIGKPLREADIREAFDRMTRINRSCERLEISANFLLGGTLSDRHHQSVAELLGSVADPLPKRGGVYLSPLANSRKDADSLLQSFFTIREKSRLPVFIYLIQRL